MARLSDPIPSADNSRSPDRGRQILRAAGALALGFGLAAGLAVCVELGYRLYSTRSLAIPPTRWIPDSLLGYRLNPGSTDKFSPGASDITDGFRGEGPPRSRGDSIFIVCLGGSTTFGHNLSWRQAWPYVTGEILRAGGVPAAVVNAGTPGYGSRQLLLRYETEIAPLAPKYVVIFEGWNRTGILIDSLGWEPFGMTTATVPSRFVLAIARHSLLVRRAVAPLSARRTMATARFAPDRYESIWEAEMDSLVASVAAHGQRPMLVIYPSLYHENMTAADLDAYGRKGWMTRKYDPRMVEEIQAKHAALRRIAAARGAPVIDVQGAISSLHGAERVALFMDEWHLSPDGNRRVAEHVAAAVRAAESANGPDSAHPTMMRNLQ